MTPTSTPVPIIDCFGRIIAVLAGQPDGSYGSELHEAFCLMQKEASDSGLGEKSKEGPHKRGSFPVLLWGVMMGMGNPHPVSLNPKTMTHLLNRLVGHAAVQRMAKYQNSAFGLWAPHIYEEYRNVHDTMHSKLNLPENFPSTIFAAAAFNLGGNIWTFKHRDWLNWPFGWCAITALGEFDASRSAQLILWELKLVINFPHAATILIPLAVITHSNTPVADRDIRTSFTQYTAGPIFRWVENGCRTEAKFEEEDPESHCRMQEGKETACLRRLENFSTVDELLCKLS
ncbi:hypothetical protein F5879DRAFT_995218 [Lentinula edodes]|nr:hypothetical protein F5879DRAFT_995218 [Lentinula edodes]